MTRKRVRSKKGWSARFAAPSDEHTVHGVKRLSYDNFLTPAVGALLFSRDGGLSTMGPADPTAEAIRSRVERFTDVALPEHVPETVWRMFEVAKGAMVYGLFFYPLYTLGEDHLSRLFEWMVKDQYEKRRGAKSGNLKAMVQWLIKNGRFPDQLEVRWLATYEIRNLVSHPTMQQITDPAQASRTLHQMRGLVVHFYGESREGDAAT